MQPRATDSVSYSASLLRVTAAVALAAGLVGASVPARAAGETTIAGLQAAVQVKRDQFSIPTITASSEHDAMLALGFVHAQDRLFQMDTLRRLFSGTLAELVGDGGLAGDIELRALGLRRAAEASIAVLSPETLAWAQAYTDGVNAFLATDPPLPTEYGALELTSVEPWELLDSITIGKGLAFGLSFDLRELDLTASLLAFEAAGNLLGFDGTLLFSEDLWRSAPFDPTISIPEVLEAGKAPPGPRPTARADYLGDTTLRLIENYRERARKVPLLRQAMARQDSPKGSNWWVAGPSITESGLPFLANDPHLDLASAPVFYEAHLRVIAGGEPTLDVQGVSFPGTPGIVLGCNQTACWGGTVHPMDTVDVYQEEIVFSLFPFGFFSIFDGQMEELILIDQVFRVNQLDGVLDNLEIEEVGLLEGGTTILVPRRNNGPIISVTLDGLNISALSVQYSGWGPTRELDAIRMFAKATTPIEFATALQFFDFGSQNWSYADVNGNIAYFTSAEMPLREDLQLMGAPDGGVAPFLIRDGTHNLKHEWMPVQNPQFGQALPYEILPYSEMPKIVNPAKGYVLSANNDPVGNTLDNDSLNDLRPGGGLFYLSPGYATGYRMGRIQRLFDEALADDGKISAQEMIGFQANNQLLDAEVLVPYIDAALTNAGAPGAPPELAALGTDPDVVEAVGRLNAWDFSTPTGIVEGWDPGDDPQNLPDPSQEEIDASVAATIYSTWRGQFIATAIDGTLEGLGLLDFGPDSDRAMTALRNLLDTFDTGQGIGASGVDFFVVDGVAEAADERDVILLQAVRDALDLLASEEMTAAFDGSTDQNDYRWGKLHRIVFAHPLGDPFNIPTAGGFEHLSPELLGIARAGGYGAVDASSHSARAAGLDEFMFDSGPARRFTGLLDPSGFELMEVLPGGESGDLLSPFLTDQLPLWLTNNYHTLSFEQAAPVSITILRPLPNDRSNDMRNRRGKRNKKRR